MSTTDGTEPPLPAELLAAHRVPPPPPGFADRVLDRLKSEAGEEDAAGALAADAGDPDAIVLPREILARYRTLPPPPGFADRVVTALAAGGIAAVPAPRHLWNLRATPVPLRLAAALAAAAMLVFAGQAIFGTPPRPAAAASVASLRVTPRISRLDGFVVPPPPDPVEVFLAQGGRSNR